MLCALGWTWWSGNGSSPEMMSVHVSTASGCLWAEPCWWWSPLVERALWILKGRYLKGTMQLNKFHVKILVGSTLTFKTGCFVGQPVWQIRLPESYFPCPNKCNKYLMALSGSHHKVKRSLQVFDLRDQQVQVATIVKFIISLRKNNCWPMEPIPII